MIKVISFDLDGTLVKSGFGDAVWLEGLPKQYALEKNISFDTAKALMISAFDAIGSDKREWYDLNYWINLLQLRATPDDILKKYVHMINLYSDVKPVIQRLSQKFTLVISSGAMKEFITIELKETKLNVYFKHFFSSTSDTHMVKKDPTFYKMISNHLQIPPEEIIHIGDDREYDYISPKKAGLKSFYLARKSNEKNEFIVNSLYEFEKKLQKYE